MKSGLWFRFITSNLEWEEDPSRVNLILNVLFLCCLSISFGVCCM